MHHHVVAEKPNMSYDDGAEDRHPVPTAKLLNIGDDPPDDAAQLEHSECTHSMLPAAAA
jgi:hypothetical protein